MITALSCDIQVLTAIEGESSPERRRGQRSERPSVLDRGAP
jgi:hypothetical protein